MSEHRDDEAGTVEPAERATEERATTGRAGNASARQGRSRWDHRVTRGAARLSRMWEHDPDDLPEGDGEVKGLSTAGRTQTTFSQRSRRSMRYLFSALPWEMLGPRPALVTLTYPATWRDLCPDSSVLYAHREAFRHRWQRKFGSPVGAWVTEFQPRLRRPEAERQAPHIHLFVGLPAGVGENEYRRLVARTLDRIRREKVEGKFQARNHTAPPGGPFAEWVLRNWFEIVGSEDARHLQRGVDVMPCFWSHGAEQEADRARIADYFWRESGKMGQKSPPENFGGMNFYGVWGKGQGFSAREGRREIEEAVALEMRRVYRRMVQGKMQADALRKGMKPQRYKGPRGKDGLTVFLRDAPTVAARVEEWATGEVLAKRAAARPE